MIEHYGSSIGVMNARKHLCWYSTNFKNSAQLRSQIMKTADHKLVRDIIANFYDTVLENTA